MPTDVCNDEKTDCCCNSVAFALSMMCLACQQGGGKDAAPGSYEKYLSGGVTDGPFCPTVSNKTLPATVQTSACQEGIKIYDDIYTTTWLTDGACTIHNNTLIRGEDKMFSRCPKNVAVTSPTTSATAGSGNSPTQSPGRDSSSQGSSESESKGLAPGAIAGIAVGVAIVIAAIIGAVAFYCITTRRHTKDLNTKPYDTGETSFQALPAAPQFTENVALSATAQYKIRKAKAKHRPERVDAETIHGAIVER
ncbi:hypothetical protein V5O48_007238 [Marasmius crinis-equi]|uniref:Uncharacterized protein n=1 Tax=Marasmius crinis-equi TaxID=585013 RepID=A0ABR3FHG4_9AGAR